MTQWKVELSNREVFIEGINFEVIEGKKSPWLRLKDYIIKYKLEIISLSLLSGEETFNLPSLNNNPKFKAFADAEKPTSYNFFRMIGQDINSHKQDNFAVIEATYAQYKLQLWVDEYTKNCWCIIK